MKYASHQSQTTMGMFPNEYKVEYRGKSYYLREHMAKGVSKDPRETLRIAFFWDKKNKVPVVGYIGQPGKGAVFHQLPGCLSYGPEDCSQAYPYLLVW